MFIPPTVRSCNEQFLVSVRESESLYFVFPLVSVKIRGPEKVVVVNVTYYQCETLVIVRLLVGDQNLLSPSVTGVFWFCLNFNL